MRLHFTSAKVVNELEGHDDPNRSHETGALEKLATPPGVMFLDRSDYF